jgi:hypothetical protein
MPEQHENNAPTAGEPQTTPGNGTDPAPVSGDPTPDKALLQERFDKGYGKGAGLGRRERDEEWGALLSEHGLGGTYDEVREALESRQSDPASGAQPPADIEETEQYKSLAKEYRKVSKQYESMQSELEKTRKRADQARLDKFARAALAKGISPDALEYFVPKHESRVRMTEDGELVVLSKMPDGKFVEADEKLEEYLDDIIESSPFLVQSKVKGGAGSSVGSINNERVSQPRGAPVRNYDPRPFSERMKGGR